MRILLVDHLGESSGVEILANASGDSCPHCDTVTEVAVRAQLPDGELKVCRSCDATFFVFNNGLVLTA